MDPHSKLAWEPTEGLFGTRGQMRPTWTIEPDVEVITNIVRHKMQLPKDTPCNIELSPLSSLGKIYTVQCGSNNNFIVRVLLPVQPGLKLLSEQGTIEYVRQFTDIPVPRILEYNAMCDDDLGFEWMIMERVAGNSMKEQWHLMSWPKKEMLVGKLVDYLAQLFHHRFDHLGGLYTVKDLQQVSFKERPLAVDLVAEHDSEAGRFCQSDFILDPLFYSDHGSTNVARGPYKCSQDWLAARLQLALHNVNNMLVEEFNPAENTFGSMIGERDTPTAIKTRIERMKNLLPQMFPTDKREEFALHHPYLLSKNIMVDAEHNLCGIIHWQCISTVPIWLACQMPLCLQGKDTNKPPPRETEDSWYDDIYQRHLMAYERTQLRELFLREMQRICPEWVQIYKDSGMKADFEIVLTSCTIRGIGEELDKWLDVVEEGSQPESVRKAMGRC